jgi:replication factor C subunit 1
MNHNENTESLMWVEKYKPSSLEDVIGCIDIIFKLSDWLKKWESMHLTKTLKVPFSKENPGAKAVLLSGPPGIGKTTISSLVAVKFGYEILEMNASDTRNKKAVTEELSDVVLSRVISSDGKVKKRLVIMDEVDGMGGSDRGGIAELIKVIKLSKTPIICICNDRQSMKIKSLANHCFDLRMRRPTKNSIAQRIVALGLKEGLMIETSAAEALAEQSGNDIRQTIHATQMWRAQSSTMKLDQIKENMHRIEKDKVLRHTPFDACSMILGGENKHMDPKASFNERYNSFFIDYSLVPLLVQQNYIDSSRNGIFKQQGLDDSEKLEKLSEASDAISDMNLAETGIRGSDMHWELLPIMSAFAVKAGSVVRGFQPFPTFPAWLGKFSTTGKSMRLTQEIIYHTSLSIGQGFIPIRLDYIPYLRSYLLMILSTRGSDGVEEVVKTLDAYGLSKEDFTETFKEFQFIIDKDPVLRDGYEGLDSKIKTAITKLYNSMEHKSQALVGSQGTSKKKRTGGGGGMGLLGGNNEDEDDIMLEEEQDEAEQENEILDVSAFAKSLKKSNSVSKKSSSSSAGTSSTSAAPKKTKNAPANNFFSGKKK